MFIKQVSHNKVQADHSTSDTQNQPQGVEFAFNKIRLLVAAGLLLMVLVFAIGTAFFSQLSAIHTMLIHAFELILGLLAGLLGGEAIAKAENNNGN